VSSHTYLFAVVDSGGNVPPELSAARRLVLAERLWDRGLFRLNGLRSQNGLPSLVHVLDQLRCARRQLVQTSPDFDCRQLASSRRGIGDAWR
jgi:hypothetical protein